MYLIDNFGPGLRILNIGLGFEKGGEAPKIQHVFHLFLHIFQVLFLHIFHISLYFPHVFNIFPHVRVDQLGIFQNLTSYLGEGGEGVYLYISNIDPGFEKKVGDSVKRICHPLIPSYFSSIPSSYFSKLFLHILYIFLHIFHI